MTFSRMPQEVSSATTILKTSHDMLCCSWIHPAGARVPPGQPVGAAGRMRVLPAPTMVGFTGG